LEETLSVAGSMTVTAFICANCSGSGRTPGPTGRSGPGARGFEWPFPVREVLVPCTGRLQPEHVLKAFESGADLVVTVSCEEDNCGYLQGSERWTRRVDYLRAILDEIGLGGGRLMLFHLPGTAADDTALSAGRPVPVPATGGAGDAGERVASIRDAVLRALDGLTPNPLQVAAVEGAGQTYEQVDIIDDDNQD
jgi:coenzyme F420-reducing hydrogenase delta subunit